MLDIGERAIELMFSVYCHTDENKDYLSIYLSIYSHQWGPSGGILSPYLFNVYVDDLSVKLNSCHVGCYYSGGCINHLMYADDFVIMSPSVGGVLYMDADNDSYL